MPLRLRLALLVTVAAAVVLAAGGLLFVHELSTSLRHSVDAGLRAEADGLADGVRRTPQPTTHALGLGDEDQYRVQVFDPQGREAAHTGTHPGRSPLDTAQRARVGKQSELVTTPGDRRVLARPVARPDGRWLIIVSARLQPTEDAIDHVQRQVLFAGGPLVLLAGLAGWMIAGAALRPVERMRRQVAAQGHHDLGPALDVPKTHDEVAALARTMNALLARVGQARRRERDFIADAGHELRTPLAILQGELELAARPGRTKEELAEALGVAAEETERLSRLAEDLLLLARVDRGEMPLRLERLQPDAILERAVAANQSRSAPRHVEIRVDGASPSEVDADPGRLREVFDNLLDNALRYAPDDSTVEVRLDGADGRWSLEVLDDGPGFAPEFLGRALDRFTKSSAHQPAGIGTTRSGSGLGLAIVASIASAHGGQASVANRETGGAIARVELPVHPPAAPDRSM